VIICTENCSTAYVSVKTLDELLGDKASLDGDIFAYVFQHVSFPHPFRVGIDHLITILR
jgi:hypothetical protein